MSSLPNKRGAGFVDLDGVGLARLYAIMRIRLRRIISAGIKERVFMNCLMIDGSTSLDDQLIS